MSSLQRSLPFFRALSGGWCWFSSRLLTVSDSAFQSWTGSISVSMVPKVSGWACKVCKPITWFSIPGPSLTRTCRPLRMRLSTACMMSAATSGCHDGAAFMSPVSSSPAMAPCAPWGAKKSTRQWRRAVKVLTPLVVATHGIFPHRSLTGSLQLRL